MKAYNLSRYGYPEDVLTLKEIPQPVPGDKEVLIALHATAINDYDWSMTRGKPYAYRLFFGLFKPRKKLHIPGMEVAGTVAAVGPAVSGFQPGDAVYGDTSSYGFGAFAEYMCIHEGALTLKPPAMSFGEAASLPHAAMLALQGLRDAGQLREGQKVLINGGGGGVGFYAMQLARLHHATVTGVDTGQKLETMLQQGFDHVLDYKQVDFTNTQERYDLIMDCKTNRYPFAYLSALNPGGRYISVGGQPGKLLSLLFLKPLISLTSKKHLHILMLKPNKDLEYIHTLFAAGHIRCIIDGPYPFEKIPWAVRRFGEGMHQGKVVIAIK